MKMLSNVGKHTNFMTIILLAIGSLTSNCLSQQTAMPRIEEAETEEFHRGVGERLEAIYANQIDEHYEILVYHYSRSNNKEKTIHYLIKAGDKAKDAYANQQAMEYYKQALELANESQGITSSVSGHIYVNLADTYGIMGNSEGAINSILKALDCNIENEQRAKAYEIIGSAYTSRNPSLSIDYLNKAIAELGSDTESEQMLWIYYRMFWPKLYSGDKEGAVELAEKGLELAKNAENLHLASKFYTCLIWVYMEPSYDINDVDKGFKYAQESLEVVKRTGEKPSIAAATFWLGWANMRKGQNDTAIELMKEAIEGYKKTGRNFGIRQAYNWLSGIYIQRGDLAGLMDMTKWVIKP